MIPSKEDILGKYIRENKCHDLDPFTVYERMEKSALSAMTDHAKNTAIGFAEWAAVNGYQFNGKFWWHPHLSNELSEELFTQYIKQLEK